MTNDPSLPSNPPSLSATSGPWYRELTGYHWFVLIVAALGWMFDCLDQNLFTLARPAAMKELLKDEYGDEAIGAEKQRLVAAGKFADAEAAEDTARQHVKEKYVQAQKDWSGYVTSIFMIGWASGGLFFGVLGDRIGRSRTMLMTVLLYSGCTGLSALSTGVWDFALYRFLTGLGVGGEFAVGVALVAEVMPNRARPYALTLLQALSAFGNISAALVNLGFGIAVEQGHLGGADQPTLLSNPWRLMFVVGALPALLAVAIRWWLKEPEQWERVSHEGAVAKQLGSYRELFGHPTWRKHALIGLALACSGVIGLWAVGFFTPDLTTLVLRKEATQQVYGEQIADARQENKPERLEQLERAREVLASNAKMPADLVEVRDDVEQIISGRLTQWQSYTFIMINVGAFFGMFGFGAVAQRIGRRPTFAIGFILAFISTVCVFGLLDDFSDIFWMVPIMGFCQLSLFAGYAMYFPELFPTHLRSTGTSFCYNVGRFIAAVGPLMHGTLNGWAKEIFEDTTEPMRPAGMAMCVVFLIGLLVLPFAPETKDKPLPD
jgi:MFS family permease